MNTAAFPRITETQISMLHCNSEYGEPEAPISAEEVAILVKVVTEPITKQFELLSDFMHSLRQDTL